MNKIIALIAITVALYGKAQCCSSTYSGTYEALGSKQYNNTMECNSDNENCSSNNESCTSALQQFISDAESLNNNTKDVFLAPIINNAAFIFNKTKVSFIYIEADLPFTLLCTFYRNYKVVTLTPS